MQQLLNLCKKAQSFQGYKLADLANLYNVEKPEHNNTAKGWAGQLIEQLFGIKNNSFAMPDFPELGVELKTIPVNVDYRPYETTYVTTVPLLPNDMTSFEQSILWSKIRHILWIPLVSETRSEKVQNRVIGRPIIWQPSLQDKKIIEQDYYEIMEYIISGEIDKLTSQIGEYLHVRPKALDSSKKTYSIDQDGNKMITSPKGFYLRKTLTSKIMQ